MMNTMNVSRFGTLGTPQKATVNAFDVKWSSEGQVYHYDEITPEWQEKNSESVKIRANKGTEIIMRLQTRISPQDFPRPGAFDGKKNLFSFVRYGFPSKEWQHVPIDSHPSGGRNRKPKTVNIKIAFVRSVDVNFLKKVIEPGKGRIEDLGPEGVYSIALNMLNLFVQAQPRRGNLHRGKSFFVNRTQADRTDNKMSPLKLLHGYFQSVRPSINRIVLNVDVTVGAILPSSRLEDTCADFLNMRDRRRLHEIRTGSPEFQKLRLFLKGVKVAVEINHSSQRERVIKDLVADVGSKEFDKGGVTTTVKEHFLQAHNKQLGPCVLGVRIGSYELIPITFCRVVNQLYKGHLQPDHIRQVLMFIPQNPQLRLKKIIDGWQNLGHQTSEFLHGGGIKISSEPLTISGRLLPSPRIVYGSGPGRNGDIMTPRSRGVWDVMDKKLQSPRKIDGLLTVNLTGQRTNTEMKRFLNDLIIAMNQRGMTVDRVTEVKEVNPQGDITEILDTLGGQCKPNFILAVLPENAADLYIAVKRFGDVVRGVATQCVRWTSKIYENYSARKCNQLHNNLILKINGKLGGVNHIPESPIMKLFNQPENSIMVIGADVSHPSPGSKSPSIASLVASVDKQATRYAGLMRIQHSRMEIIVDMQEMLTKALVTYTGGPKFQKNQPPTRIIIFRDGVSEGEFERVREGELGVVRETLKKLYKEINRPLPTITFIIVGKRHHYRFFPERGGGDKTENCQSGFVVDQDIAHPVYRDFYLQSQAGLKGTSIPSHYTILEDENFGGNPDKLQELTYAFCHNYARATRSVKIPAPVYYADLVCRRAKFHFDSEVQYSDNMSVSTGEGENDMEHQLNYYKQHFQPVRSRLLDSGMYFL